MPREEVSSGLAGSSAGYGDKAAVTVAGLLLELVI